MPRRSDHPARRRRGTAARHRVGDRGSAGHRGGHHRHRVRGWIEAADGWGLADDLVEKLAGTRLLARGPKAKGDPRGRLHEQWSPPGSPPRN
jgi:hypothetical protein